MIPPLVLLHIATCTCVYRSGSSIYRTGHISFLTTLQHIYLMATHMYVNYWYLVRVRLDAIEWPGKVIIHSSLTKWINIWIQYHRPMKRKKIVIQSHWWMKYLDTIIESITSDIHCLILFSLSKLGYAYFNIYIYFRIPKQIKHVPVLLVILRTWG